MLAAWNRKDHLRSPANCLFQGIIRCQVTGMKGNYHIYMIHPFIRSNIPAGKAQLLISVPYSQVRTMADHIFFQVQTDDPYRISLYLFQIIIHGKGKIGLTAAKINDHIFFVFI